MQDNHNIGKVENDTFQRNSLHPESDECSPISPLMGIFNGRRNKRDILYSHNTMGGD